MAARDARRAASEEGALNSRAGADARGCAAACGAARALLIRSPIGLRSTLKLSVGLAARCTSATMRSGELHRMLSLDEGREPAREPGRESTSAMPRRDSKSARSVKTEPIAAALAIALRLATPSCASDARRCVRGEV